MNFNIGSRRAAATAAAISVGIAGALTAVPAAAQTGTAESVTAASTAERAAKAKKVRATVKSATAWGYLSGETNKPVRYTYGEVRLRGLKPPTGYEGGTASGTWKATIGGKKVSGDFYLDYSQKTQSSKLTKGGVYANIKRQHVGRLLELKSWKLTWHAPTQTASAESSGKFNSNRVKVKPGAGAAAFHFPKTKALHINGYQAYLGKKAKKYKSVKKWPKLRFVTLTVQKARNKKLTKWKTIGRTRLNGKGQARFTRGVKKGGVYRVKFGGNVRHNEFTRIAGSYSGKPKKGWPKKKATYLGPFLGGGGGRVDAYGAPQPPPFPAGPPAELRR